MAGTLGNMSELVALPNVFIQNMSLWYTGTIILILFHSFNTALSLLKLLSITKMKL
jgi:hypothetical protein